MVNLNRKTALALGLGAASSLVVRPGEIALAAVGDQTRLAEGVTLKILGEGVSMIPGYEKVRLRDFIVQPGATIAPAPMKNNMVCHILEGELQVDQVVRKFTAKKDDVWTCKLGGMEGVTNAGSTVAVMRIIDLLPA